MPPPPLRRLAPVLGFIVLCVFCYQLRCGVWQTHASLRQGYSSLDSHSGYSGHLTSSPRSLQDEDKAYPSYHFARRQGKQQTQRRPPAGSSAFRGSVIEETHPAIRTFTGTPNENHRFSWAAPAYFKTIKTVIAATARSLARGAPPGGASDGASDVDDAAI